MIKYFRFVVCLTALVLSSGLLKAQAPYMFAYQGVVRSEDNQLVRNTQVDLQISILSTSETGSAVYKEKQSTKTNENGLFSIVVGGSEATGVSGTIKDIEWGNGVYFIKSEVDVDQDGTYDLQTVQQLISIPYALYANTSPEGLKDILAHNNSGDDAHAVQIKCVAPPTDNNDVVNKAYLDSIMDWLDENYGGCKQAEVTLSDMTATEDGCGTKLKVKTESSSGSVSYQWYKDDSPISGATGSSYIASTSGSYKVVATATCEDGTPATATDNKSTSVTAGGPDLTVNNIKYSGAKTGSGTSVEVDKGVSLTLTADATSSAELSYEWSGSATGTGDHVAANTSEEGSKTYKVKVTATDDKGCTSFVEKSITVSVKAGCKPITLDVYACKSADRLCFSPNPSDATLHPKQSYTVTPSNPTIWTGCENGCQYKIEVWAQTGAVSAGSMIYTGGSYFNSSMISGLAYDSGWLSSPSFSPITISPSYGNNGTMYFYIRYAIKNACETKYDLRLGNNFKIATN